MGQASEAMKKVESFQNNLNKNSENENICYNVSRQNEVNVQSDKAKTPEVAPSGVFFLKKLGAINST